jgi:hypothetical protein
MGQISDLKDAGKIKRPQERRLLDRLQSAEALLKDILQHDGGAYNLEERQAHAIMAFLGGKNPEAPFRTPAQIERANGRTWMK